jgi:hypothetical protein
MWIQVYRIFGLFLSLIVVCVDGKQNLTTAYDEEHESKIINEKFEIMTVEKVFTFQTSKATNSCVLCL